MNFRVHSVLFACFFVSVAFLATVSAMPGAGQPATGQSGIGKDDLYKPKEVRRAYANKTRSEDGRPGVRYWQNRTDYIIKAEIDPATHTLSGNETITYTNNSPDTLKVLVFHLYQNMNAVGALRNFPLKEDAITDGMHVSKLAVDGQPYTLAKEDRSVVIDGTIMYVRLKTPLAPSATAAIDAEWSFTIPGRSNMRMGIYGKDAFFVGYWYPKVSVYDDVYGWDTFQYDAEHEYYNEYGDFNVEITISDTYGVWGTGMLQNPEDVLSPDVAARRKSALSSDKVIPVVSREDIDKKTAVYKRNGKNTWKYAATNVPDFAFGASDHYQWDASSVTLPSGKRAMVNVVYDTATTAFSVVAEESRQTLKFLSEEFPGVEYPYPQMTVFRGDEGMEYPMIVNDGDLPGRMTKVYVHTHEISHTYFPFYVGINETKYGWMDEGWAYTLPMEIQKRLSDYDHRYRAVKGYEQFAGTQFDLPMMTPSTCFTGYDLQMPNYFKSSVAYEMLKYTLGEDVYEKALREYIGRWNGKHPLPYDFFYSINDVAKEDLAWFWNPWFFEQGVPDLGIAKVEDAGNKVKILVENHGDKPVPLALEVTYASGKTSELHRDPHVWKDGVSQVWLELDTNDPVQEIALGNGLIPDANRTDNVWKKN